MSDGPLDIFQYAARAFDRLHHLRPGERIRFDRNTIADWCVPANPLDRQTPKYLANWFAERLPFKVTWNQSIIDESLTFEREK